MKNILSVIILITLFYSCEDAFTTIREIDLPEHEQKLSVFSNIVDKKVSFFISHSKSMNDNTPYKNFSADVSLYKDNLEILNFEYLTEKFVGGDSILTYTLNDSINSGSEYVIRVISKEFGIAKSTQVVPSKAKIINISYKRNGIKEKYDDYYKDLLEFDVKDDENAENFYMIQLFGLDTLQKNGKTYKIGYRSLTINSKNDVTTTNLYYNGKNTVILSDKNFNGTTIKLDIAVNTDNYNYNHPKYLTEFKIKILSISKDLYNFLLSNEYSEEAEYNPFAEPVNIHSNIENGYGLFSASATNEFLFEVE